MLRKNLIPKAIVVMLMLGFGAKEALAQAGGAAVPFLLIAPNSRSSAMGDAGTGIADDLNAIFWNPGGLAFQYDRQVSLSFSKWLPQFNADLFYSYAAYGQYVEELEGYVAANFILMNLGQFTRTSVDGRILGTFRSNEFSLGLTYATQLGNDFGFGTQFRYIQSNLAEGANAQGTGSGTGISVGFDLGILWAPEKLDLFGVDLDDKLSLGFNLQNVGPSVTYNEESDPLPTMLRLGLGLNVVRDEFNDLILAVDVAKLLVRRDEFGADRIPKSFITAWETGGVELSLGAEYWYEQVFALRAGYFTEPSRIGDRQYLTFGAGVRFELFQLDFSFISPVEENHPLANTMRFTLLVDWGREQ